MSQKCLIVCVPGLEKLTNASRSVSKVDDQLFKVKLMEIANWKSRSEYMLHLTRVGLEFP